MLDSLQFMSSFQLGNPLCELITGFPFEMTADLFTFGYSASIVIIFFLMCHIIVALYYVQAKERKFSALNETQGAILCFTITDVWGKDKNPFLLSQEASSCNLCVHPHKRLNNNFNINHTISAMVVVKKEDFTKTINWMNISFCRVFELPCPYYLTI